MFEGYEDDELTKAEEKYGYSSVKLDSAFKEYNSEKKKIVKELVGSIGKTKMKNLPQSRFGEYQTLESLLDDAIYDYLLNSDK